MKFLKLLIAICFLTTISCSKKVAESVVDCLGESFLISLHHKTSTENALKIDYNVTYSGDHTLNNSIKWDFGDGTVQDLNGATASHTYAKAGTYTVIAKVSLTGGCSYDKKETITIP